MLGEVSDDNNQPAPKEVSDGELFLDDVITYWVSLHISWSGSVTYNYYSCSNW